MKKVKATQKIEVTYQDVLVNARKLIAGRGLARGTARDVKGSFCTAAALVEGATIEGKFYDDAYLAARQRFATKIGAFPSYQAIADWNDEFRTSKDGHKIFFRTAAEIVKKLEEAAQD